MQSLSCRYYKRSVSGRMLSEKSISEYLEHAFVSKVKLTCGANHVSCRTICISLCRALRVLLIRVPDS